MKNSTKFFIAAGVSTLLAGILLSHKDTNIQLLAGPAIFAAILLIEFGSLDKGLEKDK